jgi:hypothetical protein
MPCVPTPNPTLAVWGSGVRVPSAPPGFPGVVGTSSLSGGALAHNLLCQLDVTVVQIESRRFSAGSDPANIASVTAETTETMGSGESRARYMLIFRGGAVSRDDVSPSVLQAHVEKWYTWSEELARQGRRNVGTALENGGKSVGGHERIVTDGPYAESKDLVTGALMIEAASLEDAVEVAQQCPTYEFGGSVEVRAVQGEGG